MQPDQHSMKLKLYIIVGAIGVLMIALTSQAAHLPAKVFRPKKHGE